MFESNPFPIAQSEIHVVPLETPLATTDKLALVNKPVNLYIKSTGLEVFITTSNPADSITTRIQITSLIWNVIGIFKCVENHTKLKI